MSAQQTIEKVNLRKKLNSGQNYKTKDISLFYSYSVSNLVSLLVLYLLISYHCN